MTQQIKLTPKVQTFLEEFTYKINPDFQIKSKANPEGLYALVRPFALLFNKDFETRYITIVNGTCWFPASYFDSNGYLDDASHDIVQILAHETIHEHDRMRLGTARFTALYMFPQILALLSALSVFSFWSAWWLLSLLFLFFLAPLPAPGRALLEIRGYKVNLSFAKIDGWDPRLVALNIIERQFMGPNYYFMMPFKGWVSDRLLDFSHENEEIYSRMIAWRRASLTNRT